MRLRRSDLRRAGLTRRRRGRHFSYLHADGTPVDSQTRERVRALAIPPAWPDVWICPYPNGHIQAVGTDAAGRRQYLYHPQWRLTRDEVKHARVLTLARALPTVRAAIEADLTAERMSRERVLAAGLRLLDKGIFRSGGEAYADEHGTHGIATLLRSHVALKGARSCWTSRPRGASSARSRWSTRRWRRPSATCAGRGPATSGCSSTAAPPAGSRSTPST